MATPFSRQEIFSFAGMLRARFGLKKVRLTGGEPLLRSDLASIVSGLRRLGVADIGITTNGATFARDAAPLWRSGLRRVNFSLDSLSAERYRRLTRGGDLSLALGGIDAALRQGYAPIKVNVVVMRSENLAEVERLVEWSILRGVHLRFLELMPLGQTRACYREEFVPERVVRDRLSRIFKLMQVRCGRQSNSRDFVVVDPDGQVGRLGFISSQSHPFCSGCSRLRIDSAGRLVPCLARRDSVDVRHLLARPLGTGLGELGDLIAEVLANKSIPNWSEPQERMVSVGG